MVTTTSTGAIITSTLGTPAPGFNDGDGPLFVLDVINAPQVLQSGQEVLGPSFNANWTHDGFGAIVETIDSAVLSFGLYEDDSGSAGSQVASAAFDGSNVTALVNAALEAKASPSFTYSVYSFNLASSFFPLIADGSFQVSLALQGPVTNIEIFTGDPVIANFNAAHLVFSELTITTESEPPSAVIPEPGTFTIWGLLSCVGLFACGGRRNR